MKGNPTPIKVTLGEDRHEWAKADDCLSMLSELARGEAARGTAHRDASIRLGSFLLQIRGQAPWGTWKGLIARAGIDEKRAQRVMAAAAELAGATGEIDMSLVAKLREAARLNKSALPFVQTDDELRNFTQCLKLVQAAKPTRTEPRELPTRASVLSGGVRSGTPVPPVPAPHVDEQDGGADLEAWEAMGMDGPEEYEQYLAERDADAALAAQAVAAAVATGDPLPDLQDPHRGLVGRSPRTQDLPALGAAGDQLHLSDLYAARARVMTRLDDLIRTDRGRAAELIAELEQRLA